MILPISPHPELAAGAAAIHLALAILCAFAWWTDKTSRRVSAAWLVAVTAQLFFAMDSLGRIRLIIAASGREYFKHQGWYSARRPFQFVLIVVIVCVLVLSLRWMFRNTHQISAGVRMVLAGTGILLATFLNAAVSFHFTDRLSVTVAGKALGCGLIGLGAGFVIDGALRR